MSRCFDGTESLPVITLLWNWIPKKTEPKCRFKPIPRHSACGADASQSPRHLIWSCFQRDCYSLSVGANRYLRIQAWIDANLRLYGVTCGQVLTYYCNFPRDRLSLKLLVCLLEAWSSIARIQPFSDSGCFCVGGVQLSFPWFINSWSFFYGPAGYIATVSQYLHCMVLPNRREGERGTALRSLRKLVSLSFSISRLFSPFVGTGVLL